MSAFRPAIFIPIRLTSTRLPGKALLPLAGKTAVGQLVERLKLASRAGRVVICTTDMPEDDALVREAAAAGAELFRGDRDDLLARFHGAARRFDVTHIVNVDGDDVLVDPEQADAVADRLAAGDADFVKCEGLPFGAAPVGVAAAALAEVCRRKSESDTATGWGRFFTEPGRFRVATLSDWDAELRHPDIRMTLDYPEDYEFFKRVTEALYRPGKPVRLRDAVRLILSKPDLRALTQGVEKKYWDHFNGGAASGALDPQGNGGAQ
jgi:spore coat polysaccharide biosynthesis protein SpsF